MQSQSQDGVTGVFWDGAVCKAAVCTQGLEAAAWLPVEENTAGDLNTLRCGFWGAPNPQGVSGKLGCQVPA